MACYGMPPCDHNADGGEIKNGHCYDAPPDDAGARTDGGAADAGTHLDGG